MVRPGDIQSIIGRYGYVPLEELRPSKDAELAKAGIAGGTERDFCSESGRHPIRRVPQPAKDRERLQGRPARQFSGSE